jgi:outer membrane protein assembly complex protein YaeT
MQIRVIAQVARIMSIRAGMGVRLPRGCFVAFFLAAAACKQEGTITVHKLAFKGVKAVDSSRLQSALATRQSSRLPWGKKGYFDRSRFDADLKRLEAFYADRGYPDARVTGFDVKLNQQQDAVDITVTIAEGEPVRVSGVDFVGFDVIPRAHLDAMRKNVPLRIGEPRDRQQVLATHEMALNELRDHGYPYAKVTTVENDGPGGKPASVSFTAEPGIVAHFGAVTIAGNQSVGDNVIRRELSFKPGDLYRRSLVQDSQRRLYRLQLFQFATVQPVNPELQPAEVQTRVTVAEGAHERWNLGIGYGTEEKARVDAEYHHLNFFGDARAAGAHVRWSSLDRGARLDFNQPYLIRPHFSLGGEVQQWYTYTPAYRSIVTGGKATVTHGAGEHTSWAVSLTSEHDRSVVAPNVLADLKLRNNLISLGLDPRTGEQNGALNALGFDLRRSTADSLLDAHRGYQLAFHAEQAGRILPGTFQYLAISVDGRQYLPFSDRIGLASRVQLGNMAPAGNNEKAVPFSKKYFLGGATSIRGWGRFEVSPLEQGLPVGGNSLFAFSEEMRAVLRGKIGGVLFLDGGNVWADTWGINLGDLRYAVGPGLRYQTPIGPVRFDLGYQLNPVPDLLVSGQPQKRRWRIHFSIGQAF